MPTAQQLRNRRKTVAALRSGKYTQGELALRRSDFGQVTHCCLGVAAEVCNIPMRQRHDWDDNTEFDFPVSKEANSGQIPLKDAEAIFGITKRQASTFVRRAIDMNDTERQSFDYIATRMEKFFRMCDAWNAEHEK